jgi:3-hydroxyisobutyrate dehydrogenase-like beta-hydroxyacid dehydrogenase
MTSVRPTVAILGLGPMGQALAGATLTAGHPTLIWNRTAARAAPLAARGAVVAPTVAEAVRQASLVIACVVNYDALASCLDRVGPGPGTTLVNLSTGQPGEARAMARWAQARELGYLDGVILTPTPTIGTPAATVLYGGPEPRFRAHQQTLAALGGQPAYVSADVGVPAAYDLALLDLFATAVNGLVHSFALARAEGIPPRALAGFAQGIGGLLPELATRFAGQLESGRFPGDRSTIASARSGIRHVIEASDRHGLDTGVLRAMEAVTGRAVAAGHQQDGLARLAEFVRT